MARCQHIKPEIGVGCFEVGLVGLSNAGQQCCGKGAAGPGEVRVLLRRDPVERHHRSGGIPRMECWQVPIGTVPILGWVRSRENLRWVGDISRHSVPHFIRGDQGQGAGDVMLCALVAGLHFDIFLPTLEIGTRVVGERLDEGDSCDGVSHGVGRVVEWVGGWMLIV